MVPGLAWSAAETAAHLLGELREYTDLVTGKAESPAGPSPQDGQLTPAQRGAHANARQLEQITERDLPRLADLITTQTDAFIRGSAERAAGDRFVPPNGLAMTVPVMTAALLGEQLVHGLDIARAARARWAISREDALTVIGGVMALLPDYVDRQLAAGKNITYELRFRGGPRYWIRIDDGTAALAGPDQRADCWISADPVAFLLVGYGRSGQWGQILRGKLLAGGRAPWLGLSFGKLIIGP